MEIKPLLMFPRPVAARWVPRSFPIPPPHSPGRVRQGERLDAKFTGILETLRSATLSSTPDGAAHERVLVLEVALSVDKFAEFATSLGRRESGLAWLAEWAQTELPDDDDFYQTDTHGGRTDAPLAGKLFLLSGDLTGVERIVRLWNSWKAGGPVQTGYGPFAELFSQLRDVRFWNEQDRVEETGVLAYWRQELAADPHRAVRGEVELWYRDNADRRRRAEAVVSAQLADCGGIVVSRCEFPDIRYHALLIEINAEAAEEFINQISSFAVVRIDDVMFVRPVGQSVPVHDEDATLRTGNPAAPVAERAPLPASRPNGAPLVAILDGLPVEQHSLLAGRLVVDNPDDVDYPVQHRQHGTAMASLVIHGDSREAAPLDSPVYIRPVMRLNENSFRRDRPEEALPHDRLIVDLMVESVSRLFVTGTAQPGVAPTVRIVNMSLGDRDQPFLRSMSSWARALDWLSWRFRVLFVVSAGNQIAPLTFPISESGLLASSSADRRAVALDAVVSQSRHRTLIAPAESMNSITVGAVNADFMPAALPAGDIDVFDSMHLPALYSSNGLGFRRGLKPDLLMAGGRIGLRFLRGNAPLRADLPGLGRHGLEHAGPPLPGGDLERRRLTYGTSNSAALASHKAAKAIGVLRDLIGDLSIPASPTTEALFAKAALVHGALWGDMKGTVKQSVARARPGRIQSDQLARYLGYGCANADRSLTCTPDRAIVLGFGALVRDAADLYHLPVPAALTGGTVRRRLVVTLAWFSPIRPGHRKYRAANLWTDVKSAELGVASVDADQRAAGRGTLEHRVFEGQSAIVEPAESIAIQVNCRADAEPLSEPIPYVLMVTLEALQLNVVPVYVAVQERIQETIRMQSRLPVRP